MFLCGIKLLNCLNKDGEESSLIIRCGKPVLYVEYRAIKIIAVITILTAIFAIIYCVSIFVAAVKIKLDVGVLINMVTRKDGDILPTLFALPALLCLLLNGGTLLLIHKTFRKQKRPWLNTILYVFVLVCLASILIIIIFCITVLTHIYGKHQKLHDGIIDAMKNYSTNSKIKREVDLMQIEFQCCGSKKYDEWYDINWLDSSLIKAGGSLDGQTPFSCCSMTSIYPCIHHGIESTGTAYLYRPETNLSISTHGCHTKIVETKQAIGWKIIGRLWILVLLMTIVAAGLRFLQTGHYERGRFFGVDKKYTIWLVGCYVGRKRPKIPPPVPPLPPELKE